MTELQRALDFIAKMADDLAQKKVPSRYGVALLPDLAALIAAIRARV